MELENMVLWSIVMFLKCFFKMTCTYVTLVITGMFIIVRLTLAPILLQEYQSYFTKFLL